MDPLSLTMGLVGGGASLLQSATNVFNANRQMDFQEEMADTAHQREVADLKAAGLNPILSASRGAAVPSGTMATVGNPVMDGMSSALQTAQLAKTLADARQSNTQADVAELTKWFGVHQAEAQSALAANEVFKSDVETDSPVLKSYRQSLLDNYSSAHSMAEGLRLDLTRQRNEQAFQSGIGGKLAPYLDLVIPHSGTAASIADKLRR